TSPRASPSARSSAPRRVRCWWPPAWRFRDMRGRWQQAGLALLTALVVWLASVGTLFLLRTYPELLMWSPSELEGTLDLAIVCLAAYLAAVRWIERRAPSELSLRESLQVLAAGVLAGFALFSLVMAALWVAGAYHPTGWGAFSGLGRGFI